MSHRHQYWRIDERCQCRGASGDNETGLEHPIIRKRKIGLDAQWSVENFGDGRGDRPTAAMLKITEAR
jgi:hypothetical protein